MSAHGASNALTYTAWCDENDVRHAHCPFLCESPQPLMRSGKLLCGQCFWERGEIVAMIPCTPEACPQDK